ncbi:MAG: hypothetical protein JO214_06425 [Frankiaceae bacterium]|nr:hypothetical protein [Frankiaceae bacterium]
MYGGHRRTLLTFAAATTAAATIGLTPHTAAAAPKAWVEVPSEVASGQDAYYNDVTVTPGGTVWAVGYNVNFLPGAVEFRNNIERYNGSSFQRVSAPDVEGPPAQNFLYGVAAISDNNVLAVGTARDHATNTNKTRILKWNGTSWSSMLSPNPGTVRNELNDIAVTGTTAFAVGVSTSGFYNDPLVLHLVGGSWQTMAVSRPSNCDGHADLVSVYAASPTAVWAAGRCESGPNKSFVLKYDGVVWKTIVRPVEYPTVQLNGFASNADGRIFAVGSDGSGPAVLRVYPRPAKLIPSPSSQSYWAAGTTGHNGVVMAGSSTVPGTSFAGPAVGVRGPNGWSPQNIGPTFGYFTAVTFAGDGSVFAVGSKSGKPLVMHRAA